jgi:DNA-binding GntR family transcriptional regulator
MTRAPRRSAAPAAVSRGEQAYRHLCDAIRRGKLSPGTRLRESELAAEIGLSRTPVREALGRLEAEGLVASEPGRGVVVTRLDQTMVNELYFMREVLEGAAARLAARHVSDVEISLLKEIASRDRELLNEPDKLARNNRLFHETLHRCAHNRYLIKSLRSLADAMLLLGPTSLATRGRAAASCEEHRKLLAALEARDADGAEQQVRHHIRGAHRARLSQLLAQD